MLGMRGPELLIIFGIILLLFGATRLPQLGKSLGSGIRNFKKGLAEDEGEERAAAAEAEKPQGV